MRNARDTEVNGAWRAPDWEVDNTRLRRFAEKEPSKEFAIDAIHCRERLGGLLKHYYRQAA